MSIEFGEVIEGIGPAEFASVNQAHETRRPRGHHDKSVEQGIAPVPDRLFQCLFTNVLSNGAPGTRRKQRQLLPVPKQIAMALPNPELGSTRRSSNCRTSQDLKFLHRRAALGS